MLHLLVGIDTEGDNQWDAAARADQRFENLYALPKLHALFARHGIRPTYVVTYPVVSDARSADVLRELKARGDCEIGAHHHAWETPPCSAADVTRHPYASNLPDRAVRGAAGGPDVRHHHGRRATAGIVPVGPLRFLCGARLRARTSGLPGGIQRGTAVLRSAQTRSRLRRGAAHTVHLAYDSATRPGTSNVLEVPVSAALNRRLPRRLQYLYARAPRPYTTKRVLRKLGVAHVRWLRPSYSSFEDMVSLARDLARDGEPVLNLLFHSSEAIVGGSPYNKTREELGAFFGRLERFFALARQELGAVPATFSEFRRAYIASSVR